jgi:hypothetical protein
MGLVSALDQLAALANDPAEMACGLVAGVNLKGEGVEFVNSHAAPMP